MGGRLLTLHKRSLRPSLILPRYAHNPPQRRRPRASCRDRTDDLPLTRRPLWPSELRRRSVTISHGRIPYARVSVGREFSIPVIEECAISFAVYVPRKAGNHDAAWVCRRVGFLLIILLYPALCPRNRQYCCHRQHCRSVAGLRSLLTEACWSRRQHPQTGRSS